MVDIWNYPSRNDGQLTRTRGSDDLSLASYLIFLNCEWFVLLWGFNGIICVPSHFLVRSRCSGNTGSLSFSTVGFWQLPKYWENLQDALMKRHKFFPPYLFLPSLPPFSCLPRSPMWLRWEKCVIEENTQGEFGEGSAAKADCVMPFV